MSAAKEIIDKMLSSEVKGEIVVLFHKNPSLINSIEGVARKIGRRANIIEGDVKDLADLGILKRKRTGASEVVLLNRARDNEVRDIIANYLKSLKIREV